MKVLIFADGQEQLLADLTYDEFVLNDEWTGSSDTAYAEYKRDRGMAEVSDFNEEALEGAKVVIR